MRGVTPPPPQRQLGDEPEPPKAVVCLLFGVHSREHVLDCGWLLLCFWTSVAATEEAFSFRDSRSSSRRRAHVTWILENPKCSHVCTKLKSKIWTSCRLCPFPRRRLWGSFQTWHYLRPVPFILPRFPSGCEGLIAVVSSMPPSLPLSALPCHAVP